MMSIVLLLWMVAAAVNASPSVVQFNSVIGDDLPWIHFKKLYNKSYPTHAEEEARKEIFLANYVKIVEHNRLAENGLRSFTLGINKYADMTHDDFVRTMNGFRPDYEKRRGDDTRRAPLEMQHSGVLPGDVDWRKHGFVTPVKDQGQCGSCWAFSATGSLEGQTFNKTGRLVSLSEQNLVDCSLVWGNNGCEGGTMDNAFHYIADNYGDTEEAYPYIAKDDICHYSKESRGASDTGFVDLPRGNEAGLKVAVATVGPISVGIDASLESFRFYKSGVYNEFACTEQVDHAVLVVGYGMLGTQDYWLVKNSWGTSWGEDGYILMSRNLGNQCGIASMASYPVV